MKTSSGFVRLRHDLLGSAAWRTLSLGARALLIEVWRRYNGRNNGQIPYSQREAQECLRCSSKSAVKWFRELQRAGFIFPTQRGSFQQKAGTNEGRATLWRLTMEPCGKAPPTRDYMSATVGATP